MGPISVAGHKSLRFITGTVLISGSFLVYLAYPIILLILPLAESIKLAAVVTVWVFSWGAFSAGILLAGPDGVQWLKQLWWRMTSGRLGKKAEWQRIFRSTEQPVDERRSPGSMT